MKILHRHLLSELALNAVLILAAILGIFFIVALTLTLGSSKAEGVPIWLVLKYAGYSAVATLYLIIPLTVLSAAIFTYGRGTAEGELNAVKASGIHPYHALVPALAVGAGLSLTLALLHDEVMPRAHYEGRRGLSKDVLSNLQEILNRSERRIREKNWRARWEGRAIDEAGNIVLVDLLLLEYEAGTKERPGRLKAQTRAETARPAFSEDGSRLVLTLRNFSREEVAEQRFFGASEYEIDLDLEEMASRQTKKPRDKDRTYAELLLRVSQKRDLAAAATEDKVRRKALERARKAAAEFHFRVAFAFSAVIFAYFGAALGMFKAIGNRAVVFMVGFLIVVGGYYPLAMLGLSLAESGVLHPAASMWIGNLILFGTATTLFRRVLRS